MKLLYITNGVHGSGGLERVLAVKSSYLVEQFNYEITILTLNSEGEELFYDFNSKIEFYNVNAIGYAISYLRSYRKGINSAIHKIKPDVISVCDDGLKGMLFPIFFGKSIPVVYERHVSKQIALKAEQLAWFIKLRAKVIFKLMHIGGSQFNKFVVLTKGNLQEWNLENLMVIPNPLPFSVAGKSLLDNKSVLAVGKQGYQKSYDRLLQIWAIVSIKYPDWKLEIYGTKQHDNELEKMSRELGVNNSVSFFNPIKDIQEKYKAASIYVMSSRFEGFGMVLIEAMSFGVPCISFNCPHGPADIIKDGEDGYLIENGSIEGFANALIQLIENNQLRITMGTVAKENVTRYDPVKIIPLWDKLFRNLVNKQ